MMNEKTPSIQKITTKILIEMKSRGEKITSLTAYDALLSALLDEAGIEIVLVGDSAANVVDGFHNTLPITMEEMLFHTRAVSRGITKSLLAADMPFLSYQSSSEDAIRNAGRFLKEGNAEAVKMEGGEMIAETIYKMTRLGIPVIGHLGLTPQSIHQFGDYGVRATNKKESKQLLKDAKVLCEAGIFCLYLEKIPAELAKKVTRSVSVPTIGIGAGPFCDGQVLVTHDMLGLFDKFQPKFVRKYGDLAGEIRIALKNYREDVKTGNFPSKKESY